MRQLVIAWLVIFIAILHFSFAGSHSADVQNSLAPPVEKLDDCFTMPFRYVVVYDTQGSSKLRQVGIFMNPKDFSPENLVLLFTHLSKAHPGTENLNIFVNTDWSQLDLPSNCPGSGFEGGASGHEIHKFHRSDFYRCGQNSYFYYTKELQTEKMEKVVMSGTHQPKQRWEND